MQRSQEKTMSKKPSINCVCCHSENISLVGKIPQSHIFAGKHLDQPLPPTELYQCHACHLWFRYPQITKSELDKLYSQGAANTWSSETHMEVRTDWQIAKQWIDARFDIAQKILDVGCFDGGFLSTLDRSQHRCGIEIHSLAADKAKTRNIEIIGNDFSDLEYYPNSFDVVTAFDVIEHLHNPLAFLHSLAQVTRPGGWVIVSTGNTQAFSWRLMGSRYWYCTIPEHLSFISPDWCMYHQRTCHLTVHDWVSFSHSQQVISRWLLQTAKNLVYRLLPSWMRKIRTYVLGKAVVEQNPILLDIPPAWNTASDHFIILFQKQ